MIPYKQYDIDIADCYDETSKFTRLLFCIILLNIQWIIHPIKCRNTFIIEEYILGEHSLARKMNKLYYSGTLKE